MSASDKDVRHDHVLKDLSDREVAWVGAAVSSVAMLASAQSQGEAQGAAAAIAESAEVLLNAVPDSAKRIISILEALLRPLGIPNLPDTAFRPDMSA